MLRIAASAATIAMVAVSHAGSGNPLAFPDYRQTVEVTFASAEDAKRAEMKISPLPDGAKRSFGTRWDDTTDKHMAKAAMLERAGVKGAFYISANYGKKDPPGAFRYAGIRELVGRGHAIGNHAFTHPLMLNFSPEFVFREILRARMELECDTDHAVVSYASPYGWYGKKWLDRSVQRVVVEMLAECGMWVSGDNPIPDLGIGEDVWYPAHRFSADDRNPNLKRFMAGLANQSAVADRSPLSPRITLGTHSWCDEAGNAIQEKLLKENCVRPDWVQLNDYEYGAYRYSAINGAAVKTSVAGNKAVFTVRRFCPAVLGDAIPLSVEFSADPEKAECGGVALERGKSGTWRLPHDPSCKVLSKIGIADAGGKCVKLPGVEMLVFPDRAARKVRVEFRNTTGGTLEALYGVVHLPPEFRNRRRTFSVGSVPAGKTESVEFDFLEPEPSVFARGKAMYAASVDFTCDGRRNRIWATAEAEKKSSRPMPADVAVTTAFLPADLLDSGRLQAISASDGELEPAAGGVEWMKRKARAGESCYVVSSLMPHGEKSETVRTKAVKAYAVAFQFTAREDAEIKLFSNAMTCFPSSETFVNGFRTEIPCNGLPLKAKRGVNRVVMKLPADTSRNPTAIQFAACENGMLGSPCEFVPFGRDRLSNP